MTPERGRLIALEGIDGCGKSLQARRLVEALRSRRLAAATFREPGDSEYGRELRRVFVEGRDISPGREVQLFLEDRRIDVRDNIEPALAAGHHVVMDRYYLSSVVYQGSLGLDPKRIRARNEAIAPRPDLTLVLDLPVAAALQRIAASRGAANSFEGREYLERVRAAYRTYLDEPDIELIDAGRGPDEVHAEILARVLELLSQ